jgi:hypothetical protein
VRTNPSPTAKAIKVNLALFLGFDTICFGLAIRFAGRRFFFFGIVIFRFLI